MSIARNQICLSIIFLTFLIGNVAIAEPIKHKKLIKKKWILVSSQNFEVVTDGKERTAVLITEQLEKFRAFSLLLLGKGVPKDETKGNKKSRLFLTKSRGTWRAMGLPKTVVSTWHVDADLGTVIFSDIDGFSTSSLKRPNVARSIVLQAVASSLFHQKGYRDFYPLWYRQGFTQYLASYSEPKNEIMLGSLDTIRGRLFSMLNVVGNLKQFDTKTLLSKKTIRNEFRSKAVMLRDTNRFYMESFFLYHYMNSQPENRKKLAHYIRLTQFGGTPETALRKSFDLTFEELDDRMRSYMLGNNMYSRVFDRAQVEALLEIPAIETVTRLDTSDFLGRFARSILHLSDSEDKNAFLREVKSLLNTPALEESL